MKVKSSFTNPLLRLFSGLLAAGMAWALSAPLLAAATASQSLTAAGKHPFTFEDMMKLRRVDDPAVSPDGRWILFSAVDVNLDENTKKSHLWIVTIGGGEAHPLTASLAGEERGRFSPDGKSILFISARDGKPQVWRSAFDAESGKLSGDPVEVTTLSTGADGALWSPDGKSILFISSVYPDCKEDACNKARDDEHAHSQVKAEIFTQLLYRHWTSYTEFKRSHLFVVSAQGGTALDLTPGDHEVPPFNLGGQDMYAISPDSHEIAYTTNLDAVLATSTNNDVFVVPAAGGEAKKISDSPGSDSTPLYSPDGRYIAYLSQERAGYESDRFRLMLYDRHTGSRTELTHGFDRWVTAFAWSPDSSKIYFVAGDHGAAPLFVVDIKHPQPHAIEGGENDEPVMTADGKKLVFVRASIQSPAEIFALDLTKAPQSTNPGKNAVAVTHLNDAVLSAVQMQPMESFSFKSAKGAHVQGFILRPPNFREGRKYPMKFLIHGGPQGAWGEAWSYRWNPELFAANGYVVVMINPRGSTGYGQKFIDQINGDWGGLPYTDLMRGLDYVEKTYHYVDKNNECALGASYGGYMVNWIMGHTDRFKCLVSHDGMFNTESAYGATEELWFNEWEFKGTPWANRGLYRKWSPHLFAQNFKTPTLVIHSQLDYRLDVSEGFQLFTTLQRLQVPSKMLYFPDEGHWILKPKNSQLWYKTVNDWVDDYLKK